MNKIIAYNTEEVAKKNTLSTVKSWYKAGWVKEQQWSEIKAQYQNNLYTPSVLMRLFLFFVTCLGTSTISVMLTFMFGLHSGGDTGIRIMLIVVGIALLFFTEYTMIKENRHFKSGVTEAGYYVGLNFLYFGLLGFEYNNGGIYAVVAVFFFSFAALRYLDLLSVVGAMLSFLYLLFLVFEPIITIFPFIVMLVFSGLYYVSKQLEPKATALFWKDHFQLFNAVALLLVYLGGNYFVVREMSQEMMGLFLAEGEDIPFAFLFYAFTFLIPMGYLSWGILKKDMLFIRVSLLTLTLSVITIKYYYSLGHPEVTVTLAGAVMILIALLILNYLKTIKNGFTREQLLSSKWDDSDLTAYIASQTLGGHAIDESAFKGKGGEFGGAGASGEF